MVSVLPRGMLLGFIPFKSCMTAESEEKKKDCFSLDENVFTLICSKVSVRHVVLGLVIIRLVNIQSPSYSHFFLIVIVQPPHGSVCFFSLASLWHQCCLYCKKSQRNRKMLLKFSKWIYVYLCWNEQVDTRSQRQLLNLRSVSSIPSGILHTNKISACPDLHGWCNITEVMTKFVQFFYNV